MRFRILGPLSVSDGDADVSLGGQKERRLLAVLLTRPNEVVSTDALIDAMWGDDPPRSAINGLQVYVSHVRKALQGPGHADELSTHPPGYALKVAPGELDATVFERLHTEGRMTLADGDPVAAAAILRDALGLWRGDPLAGFDWEPWAQASVARLVEARLTAIEDRIDADLALGLHLQTLPELEALILVHPLRERLSEQFMLALYRSGRQAEALEAFQRARRSLVEELGIDPGPGLQRLEKAILQQDPSLAAPLAEPRAPAEVRRKEERRVVSVLFVDLAGAGSGHEGSDPEDVRAAMVPYHAAIHREVKSLGGAVERSVGDTVVAVFGAPVAHGDDAQRAVRCGVSVLREVIALNAAPDAPGLATCAAVATGEAVVGFDDTGAVEVVGDVVNRAHRLGAVEASGVVVDRATHDLTARSVAYAAGGDVRIGGRADPLRSWIAVGTPDAAFPRVPPTVPLVGRVDELAACTVAWDRSVADRAPHLVTLIGPAGIGKTRLGQEAATVQAKGGLIVRGRSMPYGEGSGYGPFGQQVKEIAGVFETDPSSVARRKLARTVAQLLPADEADSTTGYLEVLLAMSTDLTVADRLPLFYSARRFVECLASTQPTLLLFEDIHWADRSVIDLVESLAERSRDAPVLILALARPELLDRHPTWAASAPSTTIHLSALRSDDGVQLARRLLPGVADPSLADRLAGAAEGNPLFIEELAATAAERRGDPEATLPTTVRTTISARLDALPQGARNVLLDAAVVGRVFWRGSLADRSSTLEEDLAVLQVRDLIQLEPASRLRGDRQFLFKHMLIRDVAYATLPRAARRARHAEVARFLEATTGERVGEWASLLGHHWREAGDRERALEYLLMAAAHAAGGWAKSEAVALYRDALALVPEDQEDRRRTIRLARAFALGDNGDYLQEAVELDELLPELSGLEELEAVLARTKAAWWATDADGVRRFGRRSQELADAIGEPELSAPALGFVGQISAMEGRNVEMIEVGERALQAWPEASRPAELAYHMELVGLTQTWVGRFEEAAHRLERAYDLAVEVHSVEAMLRAGATLGLALSGMGHHEEALRRFDDVIERGRELELLPRFTGRALNMSSAALRDSLDLREARERNVEAIELGRRADFSLVWIQGGIDMVCSDILEGEFGRAAAALPALWEETEKTEGFHQWLMAGRLLVAKAQIAFATQDAVTAARDAEAALAQVLATDRPKQQIQSRIVLGTALQELGESTRALDELRSALASARTLGHPASIWRAAAALGRCIASEEGAADDVWKEARAAVDSFAAGMRRDHRRSFLASAEIASIAAMVG